MADEKELSPEDKAKKDREDALKEADNPPEPYPSQEQLDKIKAGEPGVLDDDDGDGDDDAAAKRKKADEAKKAEEQKRTLEAGKPGGYTTR